MKNLPLFFLALFFSANLLGQNAEKFFKVIPNIDSSTPEWARLMYSKNPNVGQVENLFQAFYAEHEFVKNIHTHNHKFWLKRVAKYVDSEGYIVLPSKKEEDEAMAAMQRNYASKLSNSKGVKELWEAQGPFNTYKNGATESTGFHANVYSIDRSLTNPDLLICGTETGGVYISFNKGLKWELLTKGAVFADDIEAVKIHPTNNDVLLISGNDRIFKSVNGGLTWSDKIWMADNAHEFVYHPENDLIVYAASKAGLFKSTDGGETWAKVFNQKCWDVQFHPTNANLVYLLKSSEDGPQSELFLSKDGGETWEKKESGWYTPSDMEAAQEFGGKIAVSLAEPDWVYVGLIGNSKEGDNGWIGLYKSTDAGENWYNVNGQDGGPYEKVNDPGIWNVAALGDFHLGFYSFDLEVSPNDAEKIWVGTIRLSESSDGGKNFLSIGGYSSKRLSSFHSDIQDIEVYDDEIWVATDGGVCFSTDDLNSFVNLNEGIDAIDFRGFGTGWNHDSFIGGRWHNGTLAWHEGYQYGLGKRVGGIEEPTGYIHPIEGRKMYYATNYTQPTTSVIQLSEKFEDKNTSLISLPIKPTEYSNPGERGSMVFDPRYSDHIIVGSGYKIYKSTNGGVNFEEIYSFSRSSRVYEIEVSRSNPQVMYAAVHPFISYFLPCEIWKSTDGGKSWAKTLADPEGNRMRFRFSIDPSDHNKIWACVPRSNKGYQVHYSSDGGNTWENRTTELIELEQPMDILIQGGTNNIAYLACKNGVYYWDEENRQWVDYSEGLPLVPSALQLNPFYRDAELRLASRGRGVWSKMMKDTTFLPIAQPITYSDSVLCRKDTVQFDCFSILNHDKAQWQWDFQPAPKFVEDLNVRNPKVVFGEKGSYSVSLTVTDKYGNSDTKTIPNMVTVVQGCPTDTVPGLALQCGGNSAYAQTPFLHLLNTNEVTMSAWVKPNGIQSSLTAIIHNDQILQGILFDDDNKLKFNWPNVSSFGSDLLVEEGKWSHVALVVSPDSISLFVNGEAFTVVKSVPKTDLGSLKIGSFKGISTRNFQGEIDEVCVWNKSLTTEEIRGLRHLTRTGIVPYTNQLWLYYQFNSEDGGKVIDRYGLNHGVLSAGAKKVTSTAPVGSGVSDVITISDAGEYLFPNSGTVLSLDNNVEDQNWVVTRLNSVPNEIPNSNPHTGNYWIINSYGSGSGYLNNLRFKPSQGSAVGSVDNVTLFGRLDNSHLNNWAGKCSANSIEYGDYLFSSNCEIDSSMQLFIQSDNDEVIKKIFHVAEVDKSICSPDSILLEGNYQKESGIFRDTITISDNIDSVYVTTLTVVEVDVSVTVYTDSLMSNEPEANYQWLECNDQFTPIAEQEKQMFKPTESGSYAVAVSKGGCADTSSCYQIVLTNVSESEWSKSMVVAPNPTKDRVTIHLNTSSEYILCKVTDLVGKVMYEVEFRNSKTLEIELPPEKAEYLIHLTDRQQKSVLSVIKY